MHRADIPAGRTSGTRANGQLIMAQRLPLSSRLDDVRSLLGEHLPWSPLDYIPGISREGDRAIYTRQLTNPLADQDDLRFVYEPDTGDKLVVLAERLPWDSEFFGYEVARLNGIFALRPPLNRLHADYSGAVSALLEEAKSRGIRYLFAQVDPRDLALLRALGENRFSLLETRLHYHYSVQIVHYVRMPDHLPQALLGFREATADDVPHLAKVAREAVNPYDRFHSDPFIKARDVERLMETWVEQSVIGKFADLTVVPDVPEPGAFMTYRLHREHWDDWGLNLVQGVLAAASPEYLGWFATAIPDVSRHLRQLKAQHCFGKTQMALGLDSTAHFGKGEHVFRIVLS